MNIRLTILGPIAVVAVLLTMPGTAHAQSNLFVSVGPFGNGTGSIYEYTPDGGSPITPHFASNLDEPRGMAFDNAGNLFVATTMVDDNGVAIQGMILKIPAGGDTPTTFTNSPLLATFFLAGLAIDSAGNVFVMAQDDNYISTDARSTIFKVTSDGNTVTRFGLTFNPINGDSSHSIPVQGFGVAFDSVGNLYAASGDGNIYKFDSGGGRSVFAGPDKFSPNTGPYAFTFDSSGNLFVSTVGNSLANQGNGEILEFPIVGGQLSNSPSTFATGLYSPRGLVFDSAGKNLFASEFFLGVPNGGDIVKFVLGGTGTCASRPSIGSTSASVECFAPSGVARPTYLAFPPGSHTTTSAGSNVTTNAGTVGFATIALTFPSVTTSGTTTVMPVNPSAAGYTLPGSSLGFDITTTATYPIPVPTPPGIIIGFQVARPLDVSQLTVLHNEGGSLVNVTCPSPRPGPTPDTTTNTIYATVASLSPFVVAKLPFTAHVQPPINGDGSSGFTVKRGVVPVIFTLTQDGAPTCTLPPATIALSRTAGANVGSVNESTYVMPADSGSNFRIDSCQYVYNLDAGGLGVGTYRVDIKISGVPVGSAIFQLK